MADRGRRARADVIVLIIIIIGIRGARLCPSWNPSEKKNSPAALPRPFSVPSSHYSAIIVIAITIGHGVIILIVRGIVANIKQLMTTLRRGGKRGF